MSSFGLGDTRGLVEAGDTATPVSCLQCVIFGFRYGDCRISAPDNKFIITTFLYCLLVLKQVVDWLFFFRMLDIFCGCFLALKFDVSFA